MTEFCILQRALFCITKPCAEPFVCLPNRWDGSFVDITFDFLLTGGLILSIVITCEVCVRVIRPESLLGMEQDCFPA